MMRNPTAAVVAISAVLCIPNPWASGQDAGVEQRLRDSGASVQVYKTTVDAKGETVSLNAYIYFPRDHQPSDRRPAIVFFFGGGWKNGSPTQFAEHCRYLASRGMVAVTADYRVLNRQGTLARECVADGKSAVRWIRENADRLGVDPDRIVAGGGSAGGHVAACTGVIEGFDEAAENLTISSRPNALALFNPAVVLAPLKGRPPFDEEKMKELAGRMGTDPQSLSPVHHVASGAPATILFHGKADDTVPYWTAESFCDAMTREGNACELIGFEGQSHGFFNYGRGNNSSFEATIRHLDRFLVSRGFLEAFPPGKTFPPAALDLDRESMRQVVVDREKGQYLGHPTTCLLEDGRTILCVYPKGHGRGGILYKRSTDGGVSWSDRLPTPDNWATSKEVPTLHRVTDTDGKKRVIMWSGLYPARMAVSENDGMDWSPLEPTGDWGGIVVMGFVEPLRTGKGHYLAMFHDDGRFFTAKPKPTGTFTLYKTNSIDGGLTWSHPKSVYQSSEIHLCEPGCLRSPDGKRLAVLLRENQRSSNSHIIFSDDEGTTWSEPRELPLVLTGDRHTGKYTSDGRLFISFRCQSPKHARNDRVFEGDWVGWVGTWDDLVEGREGQYVVRLKDNTKGYDTAYPGVEVLPDDTIVTTTYGHWIQGEEPFILSVRLKLSELDAMVGTHP